MGQKNKEFTTQDLTEHSNVLWDEDDKIVDETKLKEFADVLLSIAEAVPSLSGRVENIVGKGENAVYQYFPTFFFSNTFSSMVIKTWEYVVKSFSIPNDKILVQTKLKALADDKIKVTEKMKFLLKRVENIVGKGENAVHQHFSFFHNVLKRINISQGH